MGKIHIWALSTLTTDQTPGDIMMFRHTVHCYSRLFCSQAVGALPVSCKIWFDCWIHKQSSVLTIQLSYCAKAESEDAVYCTNQMQTKSLSETLIRVWASWPVSKLSTETLCSRGAWNPFQCFAESQECSYWLEYIRTSHQRQYWLSKKRTLDRDFDLVSCIRNCAANLRIQNLSDSEFQDWGWCHKKEV